MLGSSNTVGASRRGVGALVLLAVSGVIGLGGACSGDPGKRAARDEGGGEGGMGNQPIAGAAGATGSPQPGDGGAAGATGPSPVTDGGVAGAGASDGGGAAQAGATPELPGGAGQGGQVSPPNADTCTSSDAPDPGVDLTVKPSAGCNQPAPQATGAFVQYTVATSGTKGADATGVPGPWSYTREYFIWLPPGYDNTNAYPLVFQLPPCTIKGNQVPSLSPTGMAANAGVDGSVIRIGLTPPPNSVQDASLPNGGCFDDYEGDDSIEFPFYEAVMDAVRSTLCFDQNRVFVTGYSGGAFLGDALSCKYAGNTAGYRIRGTLLSQGASRGTPQPVTCSGGPQAGFFIHEIGNTTYPFLSAKKAINCMLANNGCVIADYDTAPKVDYPIGGGQAPSVCKKIGCCPETTPVVVCPLGGTSNSSHDELGNPGYSTLITELSAP
jgi:hypothetical protein